MKLFKKCPICVGEIVEKEVEKFLKEGSNAAMLKLKDIQPGQRIFSWDLVRLNLKH